MQREIIDEIELDRDKSISAVTDDIGDSIDHATEERYRELYQLMEERERRKLEQIRQALLRIDQDLYGFCDECGNKINKARLLALPFTRMCISCKKEEERVKGTEKYAGFNTDVIGESGVNSD